MQPARGRKKRESSHNEVYWARLAEQFKTCNYDHSGAYGHASNGRSQEIAKMAADIDYQEQVLKSEKYGELRNQGYFEPRASDRLLRAGRWPTP